MAGYNKDTLFKTPRRADDKWETANSVSRSMTEAETEARRKKTEKLRKLRLEAAGESETVSGPAAAAPTPARRATVRPVKRSLAIKGE